MDKSGYDDPRIVQFQLDLIKAKLDRIIELLEKQQAGNCIVEGVVGLDGRVQFPQRYVVCAHTGSTPSPLSDR